MIHGTMTEPTALIPIAGADGADRQFFDYRSTKRNTTELLRAFGKGRICRVRTSAKYSVIDIPPPRTTQAHKPAAVARHRPKTAQRVESHDETEGVAFALGLLAGFVVLLAILICTASRPAAAHPSDQTEAGRASATARS